MLEYAAEPRCCFLVQDRDGRHGEGLDRALATGLTAAAEDSEITILTPAQRTHAHTHTHTQGREQRERERERDVSGRGAKLACSCETRSAHPAPAASPPATTDQAEPQEFCTHAHTHRAARRSNKQKQTTSNNVRVPDRRKLKQLQRCPTHLLFAGGEAPAQRG